MEVGFCVTKWKINLKHATSYMCTKWSILLATFLQHSSTCQKDFFFSFFPGSQCVPTMFLSSSQWVPIRLIVNMLRGKAFFHFSLFPSVFSLCSLSVPNGFPSGPQCVPRHVLHSTSLVSHRLWQMLSSFHLYRWAKGESNSILQNRTFYFGEPGQSHFCF